MQLATTTSRALARRACARLSSTPRTYRGVASRAASDAGRSSPEPWRIKMLYDSMREVDMLKRRDAENRFIKFVDIAADDYDPEDNAGVTFEQAMERIHGIYPDGRSVVDIAAFKAFYEQVGLGWVYAATEIEWINKALNAVYGLWAANRLAITGRPDLETILTKKRMCRGASGSASSSANGSASSSASSSTSR